MGTGHRTYTHRFQALGTDIECGIRTDEPLAKRLCDKVYDVVTGFENRFSRFKDDSELSLLNANTGQVVTVSEEMMNVLMTAREMWELSEGIVDPTIGHALIAAGYDVTFEKISDGTVKREPEMNTASMADVDLRSDRRQVVVPPGTLLDFGGIGKGLLADVVVRIFDSATHDYWLSLGGDMVVSGTDDDGRSWPVGVQNPERLDEDVFIIRPLSGRWGIATSGITKRHGVRGGRPWHHIIDPRTGLPAVTDVLAVSIVAPTALLADTAAKTVLILGQSSGMAWLKRQSQMEALLMKPGGDTIMTEGMKSLVTKL